MKRADSSPQSKVVLSLIANKTGSKSILSIDAISHIREIQKTKTGTMHHSNCEFSYKAKAVEE
jgi:hypothetical protein